MPFFVKDRIPAAPTAELTRTCTAVLAMLICDAQLPDDVVYKFTKTFWENIEELYKVHAKARRSQPRRVRLGADGQVLPEVGMNA